MAFSTPDTQISGYVVLESDWNELVNNFIAVNGFFRVELWPNNTQAYAPLSGVTAAGSETNESSGAAVDGNKPVIPILTFIGTADEARQWIVRWPRGYGVTATVVGSYYMTGSNSDDEAILSSGSFRHRYKQNGKNIRYRKCAYTHCPRRDWNRGRLQPSIDQCR